MSLLSALRLAFPPADPAADPADHRVVVAFSGGVDSTALLWGLVELARRRELSEAPLAAHLDHGLDPGSAGRARRAARLAAALGAPFVTARRELAAEAVGLPAHPGREAAARQARYAFLEDVRERAGARWIATAHHRDDQAETVVLRLAFGSGLAGLAAIRPRHGAVVRPLLALSKAELRAELGAALAGSGLEPIEDPTNDDRRIPRNRIRHRLLPALAAEEPGPSAEDELAELLARLAARAAGARRAIERGLADRAGLLGGAGALSRAALAALPEPLAAAALALLHQRAGAPYPAAAAARRELARQLASGRRVGCDCGAGRRWEGRGAAIVLTSRGRRGAGAGGGTEPPDGFAYTLEVPGQLAIPEIGLRVAVRRGEVEPWMFAGAPRRAGLALPLAAGGQLTVRSRRPGDRLHPLGAPGSRSLKELLIDRRVPREARGGLPLVCVGGAIAWVPGIAIDERFQLARTAERVWIVELEPGTGSIAADRI